MPGALKARFGVVYGIAGIRPRRYLLIFTQINLPGIARQKNDQGANTQYDQHVTDVIHSESLSSLFGEHLFWLLFSPLTTGAHFPAPKFRLSKSVLFPVDPPYSLPCRRFEDFLFAQILNLLLLKYQYNFWVKEVGENFF